MCNFDEISQSEEGTAIYIKASLNLEVIQSLFTNCIASSLGGAIYAYSLASGELNYSKFENCAAYNYHSFWLHSEYSLSTACNLVKNCPKSKTGRYDCSFEFQISGSGSGFVREMNSTDNHLTKFGCAFYIVSCITADLELSNLFNNSGTSNAVCFYYCVNASCESTNIAEIDVEYDSICYSSNSTLTFSNCCFKANKNVALFNSYSKNTKVSKCFIEHEEGKRTIGNSVALGADNEFATFQLSILNVSSNENGNENKLLLLRDGFWIIQFYRSVQRRSRSGSVKFDGEEIRDCPKKRNRKKDEKAGNNMRGDEQKDSVRESTK
jgi:hypothetical protein